MQIIHQFSDLKQTYYLGSPNFSVNGLINLYERTLDETIWYHIRLKGEGESAAISADL